MSGCFVGMNGNGEPWRDCADAVESSANCGVTDLTCLTCDSDYCNAVVYPEVGRLNCIKCLNNDCETLNTKTEFCERLHVDERCVTVFGESNSVIERGCSSTIQNSALCTDRENCLMCNANECNQATQKYLCLSCNTNVDQKCATEPMKLQTEICGTNQCYSRLLGLSGTGQHLERGCLANIGECTGSDCSLCTGKNCNSNIFPTDRHKCYQCVGDDCASGVLQEKQCAVYNRNNKNCVTIFGTGQWMSNNRS